MSPDDSARTPDDDLDRLIQDAVPEEFSFFGRQKEHQPPPLTGIEPGRVIDDFKLIAPIGQGGMGQVWEAEQVSLNRRVALKLVRPDRVNEHTLDLFSREARAGGRLSHPGIVGVHGHGEAEGVAWISMELVEGAWTLKDFIEETSRKGELPEGYYRRVADLVAALTDALQAAHEANVIHRDLKPGNVLITPDEHPKVTDFGLAKITDETALSVTGDFAGTYAYMSPEQALAKRMGIDHRTDVFSLGVVLYELLTLRRPFDGDTSAQVVQQIVMRDPPDPVSVRSRTPRDLAVISGKCLEKEPERRYQSMAELAADIRRHLANEPILARPPTALQRGLKWVKRHPTPSAVGAVGAAALTAISILLVKNIDANETIATQLTQITDEIESVGRLSDQKDLDDLIAEADRLWPAHPENIEKYEDWIRRAEALVARLPLHRETLVSLQSQTLEPTDEERRVDRETHPLYNEWRRVEAEWSAKNTALLARRDGVLVDPAIEPDWSEYAVDWQGLLDAASPLVDLYRSHFGDEWLGLRLCERALVQVESSQSEVTVMLVMAQAQFALGQDAGARESLQFCRDALEGKSDQRVDQLAELIGGASTLHAIALAREDIAAFNIQRRELDAKVSVRRDWRFPDSVPRGRWWVSQQTALIAELEELADEEAGLLGNGISPKHGWGIERRLASARHLRDGFTEGGEYERRWHEALPGIEKVYPGLDLGIQMGLVPIGQDPDSELWEFWHVQSGVEPLRGEDGRLILEEVSGLVFVLLADGQFWMGAQSDERNGRNYDSATRWDEGPVHQVRLTAFFISKYEMTQGQWSFGIGGNPSRFSAGYSPTGGQIHTALHPVEQVDWPTSAGAMARLGLALPSEAQWEYACRGGTSSAWWTGDERGSLQSLHAANVADQAALKWGGSWTTVGDWPDLDDGFGPHAPVGTFAANPFGLHDVHGNVSEWCLDGYDGWFYGQSPVHNPLSPHAGSSSRVLRGGSFNFTASLARSAFRFVHTPSIADLDLGLRPSRAITK